MGNERELGLRIFSLYAQARVAFQLEGDMLPTARRRAREALVLLEQLDRIGPEEDSIRRELKTYIK